MEDRFQDSVLKIHINVAFSVLIYLNLFTFKRLCVCLCYHIICENDFRRLLLVVMSAVEELSNHVTVSIS
jgi:hypothetical protein